MMTLPGSGARSVADDPVLARNILDGSTELPRRVTLSPSHCHVKGLASGAPVTQREVPLSTGPRPSVASSAPTIKLLKPGGLSLGFVHDCPSLGRTSLKHLPQARVVIQGQLCPPVPRASALKPYPRGPGNAPAQCTMTHLAQRHGDRGARATGIQLEQLTFRRQAAGILHTRGPKSGWQGRR